MQFHKKYLVLAALLFLVEIVIAVFFHDRIIRPYGGDFLVVILLYCLVRGIFNIPIISAALSVLAFSFCIEILQYFNLVNRLGLQDYTIARIVIGSSFEWFDLVAYTLGIILVLCIELNATKRAGWLSAR